MKTRIGLSMLLVLLTFNGTCFSAPSERAGELKTWREQCNDPDYDMRLAYVEQAIATGDVSIQRICIRAALEGDSADIKNLGLRAAIASTERLFFNIELPKEYNEALKKAGNNERAQERVENMAINKAYLHMQEGFSFIVQGASIEKGSSTWYSMSSNTTQDENRKGPATVVGSRVKWDGYFSFGGWSSNCHLNVQLMPGAVLDGTLQCDDWWPYKVTSRLFD